MKENSLFFILNSKVIINTIEYIFIGDEDCDIEIFTNVGDALPEIHREPQIIIYEFNTNHSEEDNWHEIKKLRSALPDHISLVIFREEINEWKDRTASLLKPVRVVMQDEFFLDNLFSVISEELTKQTVLYQM